MIKVTDIISNLKKPGFSFEVLPPLKGRGIEQIFKNVDRLKEFDPLYINITTHRSEMVYKSTADGLYQRISQRNRPGTVAVAAAIQQRYNVTAVPHIICKGFTKDEIFSMMKQIPNYHQWMTSSEIQTMNEENN